MSADLPILWADKINSPLLEDFIAKHGAQYCMTAEEINQLKRAVNEMAVIQQSTFMGAAEPADTPTGTGNRYWTAVSPGTYTNFGGVVVGANSLAIISVIGAVWSVSQTSFDITSKVNVSDVVNNLNSTSTVDPVSALQAKILDEKIVNKADLTIGKNKFNKDTAIGGFYVNEVYGGIAPNAAYTASDFIPVLPNTDYFLFLNGGGSRWAFYDADKVFISGIALSVIETVTTVADASFAQISFDSSVLNDVQLELGSVKTPYESYNVGLNPAYLTGYAKIADLPEVISPLVANKADLVIGKNKFNKDTAIGGFYVNEVYGGIAPNAAYTASDFIPVLPNTDYFLFLNGGGSRWAFYDADKVFISGIALSVIETVTTVADASFAQISFDSSVLNDVQLELGSVKTPYESYNVGLNPAYLTGYAKIADLPEVISPLVANKADLVIGKNKFNKDTAVVGEYLGENNVAVGSATYDYSDFIEVTESATYISNYGMRFTTYFDVNKNYVAGGSGSAVTGFTVPSGVRYVKITVYHSNLNAFQLEIGNSNTAYSDYKMIVPSSNLAIYQSEIINDIASLSIKLFLPKEVCVAVGRTIELYHNQISWCGNIDDYHFVWSGIGKSMKRKWTCTGVTIGNNVLTLKVYDKNNVLLASKTTNVRVVSATINTPFTIAAIGDSLSNQKPWGAEVRTLAANNVSFVGTRVSGTSEGRSGASAEYYLGNYSYSFDNTGIVGNDGRTQDLNPFFNPVLGDVDFAYYKSNYNQNPAKLLIWLGTNAIEVDPTTNATNIKTFVDKIRATGGTTIPIFVVHTLFRGNQDGIGKQEGNDGYVVNNAYKLEEDLKVFNLQEKMLADLKDYANLYLVPVSTCHDSEFNFGAVSTPVNPRASQVEFLPVEATHPQTQGYLQIADIIFSSLAANQ